MILQFGTGNFLRAFADVFVEQLDQLREEKLGQVIAVQSTGRKRADALNAADGSYHVAIQGFRDGEIIDETIAVHSLGEALYAGSDWERVLEAACDPSLIAILSNTTEAGLALDEKDSCLTDSAPHSFPAKLLAVLIQRHASAKPGPWILPCELLESNGDILKSLVLEQADIWKVDLQVITWLEKECHWVNTLVDRIVPGPPKSHPLLDSEPLLLSAEPFAMWAVETENPEFPFADHPAVILSPDISPYTLRKVRILNGAHSALVCRAEGTGVETVRDCLDHPEIGQWLEELLFEEIVPVLEGRCDDPAGFARDTLDRFRNPFLEHSLSAIALHHEEKMKVRLEPTLVEFREKFGKDPERLASLF